MKYRIPDHIYSSVVHDEVMLLDTRSDEYLGLNRTASLVWHSILGDGSLETAAQKLAATFEVTGDVARTHVESLVHQLLAKGLLEQGTP